MPGINLVGAPPTQPFDIQTQQAQLARAQDLATAMLGQDIKGGSPVLHTGGNNPFARDVPNIFGPLGDVISSAFSSKALGGINQRQQDLANQLLQQRQADISSAFSPTLQNGAPSIMGTIPPSMMSAAQKLLLSNNPGTQQIGVNIISKLAEGEQARQVTPSAIAALTRGGVLPSSIHTTPGVFNFPTMSQGDVNSMLLASKPENLAAGVTPYAFNPQTAQSSPPGPPALLAPRTTGPGDAAPIPSNVSPTGQITPVPGPVEKMVSSTIEDQQKNVLESQEAGNQFVQDAPKYQAIIKLAQMAQTQGTTGSFGDQLNAARQLAVRVFGFSSDDANKITNFGTMMKLALTPAAHAGRQEVGGRYTQLEFSKFLEAGAASGWSDPRVAQNVFTQQYLDNLNHLQQHQVLLDNFAKLPGVADSGILPALQVRQTPEQMADKYIQGLGGGGGINPPAGAQPVSITFDKGTGTWANDYLANPQQPMGSAPQAATNPRAINKSTGEIRELVNGKWQPTQ